VQCRAPDNARKIVPTGEKAPGPAPHKDMPAAAPELPGDPRT